MDEPLVITEPIVIPKKTNLQEELRKITEESHECLTNYGSVELHRQGTEFTVGSPENFGENRRGSGLAVSNNEVSQAGEYKIQILKHMDTADIFSPFIEEEDGDEFGEGQSSDLVDKK